MRSLAGILLALLLANAAHPAQDSPLALLEKGQAAKALKLAQRAAQEAETEHGSDALQLAARLDDLAYVLQALGQYDKAKPLYQRSLEIRVKRLRKTHPKVAVSLNHLGEIASLEGEYDAALSLFEQSIELLERNHRRHPDLVLAFNNLGGVLTRLNRLEEAEKAYRRALSIERRVQSTEPRQLGILHGNLAGVYRSLGRYQDAAAHFDKALSYQARAFTNDHPEVGITYNNYADLDALLGRYAEAIELGRKALEIFERHLGVEHPNVAVVLGNLAGFYLRQGQHSEAVRLLQRALLIQERSLGPNHPQMAASLTNLMTLYYEAGEYSQAAEISKRILAINEHVFGKRHPLVAQSLRSLGEVQRIGGKAGEARTSFERALATIEAANARNSPEAASILSSLGLLYQQSGEMSQSEKHYLDALETARGLLGDEHPLVASIRVGLAKLYLRMHRFNEALEMIRGATALYRARITRGGGALDEAAASEHKKVRGLFLTHLQALASVLEQSGDNPPALFDEAFTVAQLAQTTSTAGALSNMGARFASGDDALASLLRQHQDRLGRRQALETNLLEAMSTPGGERNFIREGEMREEIEALAQQLSSAQSTLAQRFPKFAELTNPEPLSVAAVQKLLGSDEVMISYVLGEEQSLALLISRTHGQLYRLTANSQKIEHLVSRLRAALDPLAMETIEDLEAFPLAAAHSLYGGVFEPFADRIKTFTKVYLVLDQSLQNLPLSVLIASAPVPGENPFSAYRDADWLIKRHALTVLPSAGSLASLRAYAGKSAAQKSFVGFGDPDFAGSSATMRGIFAEQLFVRGATAPNSSAVILQQLRELAPLPDTADELQRIGEVLGADSKIYLRADATEANLYRADLGSYRILAFATHGLMAGDFSGLAEPALVLSPPQTASPHDDGLLTASDITGLELDADWVILSACNTAAPAGKPGADGLSGLAKSFFYAGSRALLVSHWPVASEPTVKLTTGMFSRLAKDRALAKSEALRQSMLALMEDNSDPALAHPIFWAPFIVVGEGGALSGN